MNSWAMMAVAS